MGEVVGQDLSLRDIASRLVITTGKPEQRERWLPGMGRMEQIGAFASTEPQGGSDVAAGLRTTARRDGDGWVLDGANLNTVR